MTKKIQKKSKNQNWAIFDFSLIGSSVFELWPKNCKSGKAGVHFANRRLLYCPTVLVVHRWSHWMLLPTFYLWSFLLDTQWATEKRELMAGYLYLFQVQDLDWDPDSLEQNWICGNFPPLCLDGKIPTDPVLLQWIWIPIQILHLKKV